MTVNCAPGPATWSGDAPWNAAHTGPGDVADVNARLCQEVTELVVTHQPRYDGVFALFVIAHEATHLAGGPRWLDETYVQCRALRAMPALARWLKVRITFYQLQQIWFSASSRYRQAPCLPYG